MSDQMHQPGKVSEWLDVFEHLTGQKLGTFLFFCFPVVSAAIAAAYSATRESAVLCGAIVLAVVSLAALVFRHLLALRAYRAFRLQLDKAELQLAESRSRSESEKERINKFVGEITMIPHSLSGVLRSKLPDNRYPQQIADTLIRTVLMQTQTAMEAFCPSVLCSVKLPRTRDQEFECIFPDRLGSKASALASEVCRLCLKNSYAADAMKSPQHAIFVPDLLSDPPRPHPFNGKGVTRSFLSYYVTSSLRRFGEGDAILLSDAREDGIKMR